MAFSYDATSLTEPLNRLRFLVQDTADVGHFLEDEEILFASEQDLNVYRVAAGLCRTIAAKLSRTPSQEDTTVKFESGERAQIYLDLAKSYDDKALVEERSLSSTNGGGLRFPTLSNCDPAFTRKLDIF